MVRADGRVTDPAVRASVDGMLGRIATVPHVVAAPSPYGQQGTISPDGRTIVAVDDAQPALFLIDTAAGRVSDEVRLEGVPGIAKTLAVETFAKVMGGSFSRIQFTPDLVPADLIGTRIYRQGRESFDTELGPVVANFVLADETLKVRETWIDGVSSKA